MRQLLYINVNGILQKNDKPVLFNDNRSFRYGDGCFETMKMINGKIVLESFHLERIFTSLQLLKFDKPNYFITDDFMNQIVEVAKKNGYKKLARIRVTIYRGEGLLTDIENNAPHYVIEATDLNSTNNKINTEGLALDIFKDAKKVCDKFSCVKSNNYLQNVMATFWWKEKNLNDALLLNVNDRIAESTIANIFIVKNNVIKTPALTEGCVGGVMRKFLLKQLREKKYDVEETQITISDLLKASEVFLTNAVYGIRWVQQIGEKQYKTKLAKKLYEEILLPIYT